MATSIDSLLRDATAFVEREFGLSVEESRLKLYSAEDWPRFCRANGFDGRSDGIYVPRSHTAYAKAESEALIPTVFHEYFGHGLFCEHSSIGKRLAEIEEAGEDGEAYRRQNLDLYEGFALWMEALLCEETGYSGARERLSQEDAMLLDYFREAERTLGRPGLMTRLGFQAAAPTDAHYFTPLE